MAAENVLVEMSTPSGKGAYSGVSPKRVVSVTSGAGTVTIDGVTYTRTSPLRTQHAMGETGYKLDDYSAMDASQRPVTSSPSQGATALPIFSASGT